MSGEDDVRRAALALPGVTEGTSYGTLAFRVAGRIFARMHDEPGVLVCWRPDGDARDELLAADPEAFFTTAHYAGHASVLVRLDRVDAEELTELLTEAWESRAPARLRSAER